MEGCRKGGGPNNRLGLKLAGGLTLEHALELGLLYISIEVMRSLASNTTKMLL